MTEEGEHFTQEEIEEMMKAATDPEKHHFSFHGVTNAGLFVAH